MINKHKKVEQSIALLFIDRFLERIGDHIRIISGLIVFNNTYEYNKIENKENKWHKEKFL